MKYQIRSRESGDFIDEFDSREKAEAALNSYVKEGEGLVASGLTDNADPEFYEIVEVPLQLEKNEFMLIVDSTNAFALYDDGEDRPEGNALTVKDQIILNVRDSIAYEGLAEKWGINAEKLMEKMNNASENEYKELWKQIEDFWAKNDRSGDDK